MYCKNDKTNEIKNGNTYANKGVNKSSLGGLGINLDRKTVKIYLLIVSLEQSFSK